MGLSFADIVGAAGLAVLAFTVSGCSLVNNSPLFAEPQEAADLLPRRVSASGLEEGSTRYLGSDSDGVDYFAARTSRDEGAEDMICIVVVTSDDVWTRGCSVDLPVTVRFPPGKEATLYPDNIPGHIDVTERVGNYVQIEH